MCFGAYGEHDVPPPMAETIATLLDRSLVVASAGNNGSNRPYFPAALPNVVAVGALESGGRASFSNWGPWVDACAPGVEVVSTFFKRFDDRVDAENGIINRYRGWATWSGTSFAAPKVAALVAQEMYLNGGTAHQAWSRLRSYRRYHHPELGQVFNV